MAHPLHQYGPGCSADFLDHRFTIRPICGIDPDFDQFMIIQRLQNFVQNGWGYAVVPDDDNGLAGMSQSLEMTFLRIGEREH